MNKNFSIKGCTAGIVLAVAIMVTSLGTAQEWVARYNGPGYSYDYVTAMAVDGSGNVYVTGKSTGSGTDYDYTTIKYNSAGIEEVVLNRVQHNRLEVYPDPWSGRAVVKYTVPEKASITLQLYDIAGRLVNTIYSGVQKEGDWTIELNSKGLTPGIYFIRFNVLGSGYTKRMLLIK